jgi:16S rRNA (uracil1498-N3)-methyltransferase
VELGVNVITPIISARAEHQEAKATKLDRWLKIIISACEQSGRCDLPVLNPPIILEDWLKARQKLTIKSNSELNIGFCTKTNQSLKNLLNNTNKDLLEKITIIIGPEGGLAPEELNLLSLNKFNLVSLGSTILRTETAGIVSLGILNYWLD